MQALFAEGCLLGVPWVWLREYPRYLQAIATRLERLKTLGPAKDAALDQSVANYWKHYQAKLASLSPTPWPVGDLLEFRWAIEEFRVSVFAQQLGTKIPVSAKRLEKMMADLK